MKNRSAIAIGAVSMALMFATIAAVEHSPGVAIGRYQISTCGTSTGARAFVVDTATGQVWYDNENNFYQPKLPTTQP